MAVKTNLSLEEAVKQYEELIAIPGVVETAFRREMAEADIKANEEFMRQAGIAEGKVEGRIEERSEIAQKMLKQKVNKQLIIQVTGLTRKELEELKES